MGRHIDGCDVVYGGYGVDQRNLDGRTLFEFCLEEELCVSNKWSKGGENRKVTFKLGEMRQKLTLCR